LKGEKPPGVIDKKNFLNKFLPHYLKNPVYKIGIIFLIKERGEMQW